MHRGFRLVPNSVTLMTLNGVITADPRYLCGSCVFINDVLDGFSDFSSHYCT